MPVIISKAKYNYLEMYISQRGKQHLGHHSIKKETSFWQENVLKGNYTWQKLTITCTRPCYLAVWIAVFINVYLQAQISRNLLG